MVKKHPTIYLRHFNDEILLTTKEIAEQRLSHCLKCGAYKDFRCTIDATFLPVTTRVKSTRCPAGLWGAAHNE
jgi:hypothetical protein